MNLPLHLGNTFYFLDVCGVCSHTCPNAIELFLNSLLLNLQLGWQPARSNCLTRALLLQTQEATPGVFFFLWVLRI